MRLGIVPIQKDMKSAANDHCVLRLDVECFQCLADGLPHEALAGQRAVGDQGSGIDRAADRGAKKGHVAAQPFVDSPGMRRLEEGIPRFVPASVSGRLGQQPVELACHGNLMEIAAAPLRHGLDRWRGLAGRGGVGRGRRRGRRNRQGLGALDGVMRKVDEDGLRADLLGRLHRDQLRRIAHQRIPGRIPRRGHRRPVGRRCRGIVAKTGVDGHRRASLGIDQMLDHVLRFVRPLDEHDFRTPLADAIGDLRGDRRRMVPHGEPVKLLAQNVLHAGRQGVEIERCGAHGVRHRRLFLDRLSGHGIWEFSGSFGELRDRNA